MQTIRHYEEIGLIQPFTRSGGGHRVFAPEDVQRLKFIRHARELGFGIEAIRELLRLSENPDTSCAAADAIARTHLEQVEIRLTKLRALRKELRRMVEECGHGQASQCRVIEVLSDHRHCASEHWPPSSIPFCSLSFSPRKPRKNDALAKLDRYVDNCVCMLRAMIRPVFVLLLAIFVTASMGLSAVQASSMSVKMMDMGASMAQSGSGTCDGCGNPGDDGKGMAACVMVTCTAPTIAHGPSAEAIVSALLLARHPLQTPQLQGRNSGPDPYPPRTSNIG